MQLLTTEEGLLAPIEWVSLSEEEKTQKVNGCGPSNRLLNWLVPETMYGLSVTKACNIHDFMYELSLDKKLADEVFKKNLYRLIDQVDSNSVLRFLRRRRADLYYAAVTGLGRYSYN